MYRILIIFLLAICSFTGYCQKPMLKLRQSFQSAAVRAEPAIATFTKQKNTAPSYLVDGAIGLDFSIGARQTLSSIFEYHRNTLVNKESNTIQGGAAYELFTNRNWAIPGLPNNRATTVLNATGKYSNNRVKGIEAAQLSIEFTRLYARGGFGANTLLPNTWNQPSSLDSQIVLQYFPSVGIEYEGRFKTKAEVDKGNVFRPFAKFNINIYPLAKSLKRKLELFSNMSYRYDVINSTGNTDKTHPSIEAGANIVLNADPKVSLGFSYNNIDNPALGQEKQEFWLVALKIKF